MATLQEKLDAIDDEVLDRELTDLDRLELLESATKAQIGQLKALADTLDGDGPTPVGKTIEGTTMGLQLVLAEIEAYNTSKTYRDAIVIMDGFEKGLKGE